MKIIIYSIIFLITVIVYIHIIYHLKTTTDESVYEIDYTNKKNLNEICDLRQPFTFKFKSNININKENLDKLNCKFNIIKSTKKEIKNKDTDEKEKSNTPKYVNLIYSEYNNNIINISNINNEIIKLNKYISPEFTLYNKYDIIYSDENIKTPITSNFNYRNFFYITEGNINIKFMSHLHNDKINYNTDYELIQNISEYNIWNNNKKIKTFEITATTNDIIYIPPHWWYSIQFNEPTTIIKYHYRSLMNVFAYFPYYIYSYISTHKANNENKKKKLKKHK